MAVKKVQTDRYETKCHIRKKKVTLSVAMLTWMRIIGGKKPNQIKNASSKEVDRKKFRSDPTSSDFNFMMVYADQHSDLCPFT